MNEQQSIAACITFIVAQAVSTNLNRPLLNVVGHLDTTTFEAALQDLNINNFNDLQRQIKVLQALKNKARR